jgi:pyruvate dehydrogenase E2 component (dihydrolipoamide acetyltransferase)
MAEPVLMPQVGQDIKTARIGDWLRKEGQVVTEGEVIAVVESDKAAFDVEANTSGVLLKILYPEGEEAAVLTPIAYIGRPGESVAQTNRDGATAPEQEPCGCTQPAEDRTAQEEGRIAASPSARRLAREQDRDLQTVKGTGPGGRITKADILAVAANPPVDEVVAFSPMRARIAERLTRSQRTIPHFYLSTDVDMSEAVIWRRQFNENRQTRVTITDMIVKAAAAALSQYARMNAHVEPDRLILKREVNVGVAVSLEDGLIVPVIANADRKDLVEISDAARENAEAARAGRLKPQAVGSFTVTNLGMFAVDAFVPIINPPEAAILAVGAVAKRPAVVDDRIVARDLMTMVLACDHRAVDGTYAARFLGEIRRRLENPGLIVHNQS